MHPVHSSLFSNGDELFLFRQDLLPGIVSQLGPDNLASLKKIAQQYEREKKAEAGDDDDDVPDLVENFEEASKK